MLLIEWLSIIEDTWWKQAESLKKKTQHDSQMNKEEKWSDGVGFVIT